MRNLDQIKADRTAIMASMLAAMKRNDSEGFASAMLELSQSVAQEVKGEYEQYLRAGDVTALAARGVKPLTSEEVKYYTNLSQALRASDPKQALAAVDTVLPRTTVNRAMDDLMQEHPLLAAVDMVNTGGMVEYITNTDAGNKAVWGNLTDAISKEIESGFKVVNVTLAKLSAFIPVPNSMIDLGPEWLEQYVRTILVEAIALGLEDGIVSGDGDGAPIGMSKDVSDDVLLSGKKYPDMETTSAVSFAPADYGALVAKLAVTPSGRNRAVNGLILVCNPADYLTKVMPATTMLVPSGGYVGNVLPYPTNILQSVAVPTGKAILGIGKNYFLGIGTGGGNNIGGKIEYSDDFKWLEDMRTYRVKLYGNGMPKDATSFILLDISALKPLTYKVETVAAGSGD